MCLDKIERTPPATKNAVVVVVAVDVLVVVVKVVVVVVVVVVVPTINGACVSPHARTLVQLNSEGEKHHTPFPCRKGRWRWTSEVNHPHNEVKSGVASTTSLCSPDPGRTNLFDRSGVGSTKPTPPERLPAEPFPMILKRPAVPVLLGS